MRKNGLAVLVFLVVMSALWSWAATFWQLQTKLNTAGGTITVRDKAPQSIVGSIVFSNFTTSELIPVTVAANTGYNISSLTKTGSAVPIGNYTSHYSTTYQKSDGAVQALVAGFAVKKFNVTSQVTGPGTINPASALVPYNATLELSANPSFSGAWLTNVTGGTTANLSGDPVTFPFAGPVKITVSNVTEAKTVTATYVAFSANAGVDQIANINSPVSLNGSITGGGTPSWSQISGPPVTIANAGAVTSSFTPSSVGTYVFRITEIFAGTQVASDNTEVTVVNSLTDYMRSACNGCHHNPGGIDPSNAFPQWSSSSHKIEGVTCITCHTSSAMPTPVNTNTVDATTFTIKHANAGGPVGSNFCFTCHHKANNLHYHSEEQVANICITCHLPNHNPAATMAIPLGAQHFNGYTSTVNPNYRAAYVTPATQCANCHITTANMPNASDPALLQQRLDWANSGHADTSGKPWLAYDYKTLSGCVQCHTTKGFIAYSSAKMTAAWGTASKTRDVLSCNGCHTDINSGALRTSLPIQPYTGDTYTNPDLGNTSNLCLKCHSGLQSGRSIKAQAAAGADFTNLAFISSHSSAAAGILFKSIGYEFSSREYGNKWHFKHDRIGISNYTAYGYDTGSDGPCVGCHMSSPNRHTFSPLTRDGGGVVTAVTSTSCAGCHTGPAYLDGGRMNAREAKFAASLLALQKVLESRGIYYTDAAPYFFRSAGNSNPSNAVTNWGNADTMGAAFNFNLLQHEPGAYVHNMIYTKRLIYDSIDFLDNGEFDNSVISTINCLPSLDATQKGTAVGYLVPSGARP